jgi:hypothetical protein
MNYEYKVVHMKPSDFRPDALQMWAENNIQKTMNDLSTEGWEYIDNIAVNNGSILVFRRVRR